jgi:hypothetical protein
MNSHFATTLRIALVVPVGPKDDIEDLTTGLDLSPMSRLPWVTQINVVNGREKPDNFNRRTDLHFETPLGITEAHRVGVKEAVRIGADYIVCVYSAPYRRFVGEMIHHHLAFAPQVTITYRIKPKWRKFKGKCLSRMVHYAARHLLALPYRDNCSGLYMFSAANEHDRRRVELMFDALKSRDHFFDTELRYQIHRSGCAVGQMSVVGIVTGGNTLNWAEAVDTATCFFHLLWRRLFGA